MFFQPRRFAASRKDLKMACAITDLIKIAVITGGHSFDVISFHRLFRGLDGVDAYIQHMDDFASSHEEVRDSYHTVVFYSMLQGDPCDEDQPLNAGKHKTALEHLGESVQGLVLLHHAILAYRKWSIWNEIVGITNRQLLRYDHDQALRIDVAHSGHPITAGLSPWEMVDETYSVDNAGHDSEILLTTDHALSMKTIAWTRNYENARVFCCALGHDNQAWSDASFRTVLTRGIRWAARPNA
jgi:type 1 glutamine amidotransferase